MQPHRAHQTYNNVSMLFLFPVKIDLIFIVVSCIKMAMSVAAIYTAVFHVLFHIYTWNTAVETARVHGRVHVCTLSCTRVHCSYMAVDTARTGSCTRPCTRVQDRVHGRVHIHTARTRTWTWPVLDSGYGGDCTRPCTRPCIRHRHISVVAIRLPFCGKTPSYCAWLLVKICRVIRIKLN